MPICHKLSSPKLGTSPEEVSQLPLQMWEGSPWWWAIPSVRHGYSGTTPASEASTQPQRWNTRFSVSQICLCHHCFKAHLLNLFSFDSVPLGNPTKTVCGATSGSGGTKLLGPVSLASLVEFRTVCSAAWAQRSLKILWIVRSALKIHAVHCLKSLIETEKFDDPDSPFV